MSTDTPGKTEAPDVKPVLSSQSETSSVPTSLPATTAASTTPKTQSQSLVRGRLSLVYYELLSNNFFCSFFFYWTVVKTCVDSPVMQLFAV